MDPIERIASMLDESELVGAEKAPMSHKVVPFVFEHLSQINNEELQFESVEGDAIVFNVVIDGTTHQYKMKIEYAGSSKPEQTDPAATRAAQMRRGAAQSY
jgi:hypothetical protein